MKKVILYSVVSVILLLSSCNAAILMNNGDVTVPDYGNSGTIDGKPGEGDPVSLDPPRSVNATKSYYSDTINVIWSPVSGADYYTLEKCAHTQETLTGTEEWVPLQMSVFTTSYSDTDSLQSGMFYSYRVTAHTLEGVSSSASDTASGTVLASPRTINVSQGTSETSIDITWNEMPYVDSYRIYMSRYSTISGVESEVVATVAARTGSANAYTYAIGSSG